MANEYLVNGADLTSVADAIRAKNETSEELVFPAEFVAAIEAFKGGEELNFSVVAYASETALPETAAENTIAVITTTHITGYLFSADEPTNPIEGNLWIGTVAEGNKSFNALKGNTLMVYPFFVQQYIDGTWLPATAFIYQKGTWVDFITYLYELGNEYIAITGGLRSDAVPLSASYTGATPTLTKEKSSFTASLTYNNKAIAGVVSFDKTIDLTNYDTLHCKVNAKYTGADRQQLIVFGVRSGYLNNSIVAKTAFVVSEDCTLDISGVTGSYYVGIELTANGNIGSSVTIEKIWLT